MTGGAPGGSLVGWIAEADVSRRLVELARRAAARAQTVLITGETGTGKARLARAMHDAASGPEAPFVVVAGGNLSEALVDSELFGHEADAFSGATGRRPGRFELARTGTVLLERVEDLPLEVQGKLLRVLQERVFERVGGSVSLKLEARVVATSSADLPRLVREGRFREDLLYRLDVVHLHLPALRDRDADVPALARAFLEASTERAGRRCRLEPAAVEWLRRQSWPGNVRQLQNVLDRAVTLTDSTRLAVADLESAAAAPRPAPDRAIAELAEQRLSLHDIEELYIRRVLRLTGGRIGQAATLLGIHRKTLLDKRKRYGID